MTAPQKTLNDWLARISALHPSEIELGLERVRTVLHRLMPGTRRIAGTVVTVAGTNGKGSTLALVERLARDAGRTVCAYTSPHLLRFTERLRIQGAESEAMDWVEAFEAVDLARGDLPLTYFEFTTLAAIVIIDRIQPDVALLEVGLGGRLDAVNVIDPDLAVITPIDLDHTDWLGEDKQAIGREKAGILRPGIPLVSGDPAVPQSVLDTAEDLGCPVYRWQQAHGIVTSPGGMHWYGSRSVGKGPDLKRYLVAPETCVLPFENVSTALQVASLLGCLPDAEPVAPWQRLGLPGRIQRVARDPDVILDVGHNPHAARFLAGWLSRTPCQGRTHAVYSALSDKAVEEVVATLAPHVDSWTLAPLQALRAMPVANLSRAVALTGATAEVRDSVADALKQVCMQALPEDRILVLGSFYTVAEALGEIQG